MNSTTVNSKRERWHSSWVELEQIKNMLNLETQRIGCGTRVEKNDNRQNITQSSDTQCQNGMIQVVIVYNLIGCFWLYSPLTCFGKLDSGSLKLVCPQKKNVAPFINQKRIIEFCPSGYDGWMSPDPIPFKRNRLVLCGVRKNQDSTFLINPIYRSRQTLYCLKSKGHMLIEKNPFLIWLVSVFITAHDHLPTGGPHLRPGGASSFSLSVRGQWSWSGSSSNWRSESHASADAQAASACATVQALRWAFAGLIVCKLIVCRQGGAPFSSEPSVSSYE